MIRRLKEILDLCGPHEIVALACFISVLLVWAAILPEFLRQH